MLISFIVVILALSPFVSTNGWESFSKEGNFTVAQSNQVTLFDHDNYNGDAITVSINPGECTNVLEFNNRTTSVKLSEGCVRLWLDSDCKGGALDVHAPGESDLQTKDFNDKVSSVSFCQDLCVNFRENVEIEFHLNGANDLATRAESIKKVMQRWFPFIQGQLFTPAYKNVAKIEVFFDEKDEGRYTYQNEIHVPQEYLRKNPNAMGIFIHEMAHIIHQARNCPHWVSQATAEYMRRWFYEPKTNKPKPTNELFNNAYITDWLIVYLNTVMKRPIFYEITKACQEGSWRGSWLKDVTGKDEHEWWRQMVRDDEFPWKRVN